MGTRIFHASLPRFFVGFFLLGFSLQKDLGMAHAFVGTYGINYGRIADNIPSPQTVVAILKRSMIRNIRIYDSDHDVLRAFKGSGIELIISIPNEHMREVSISEDHAMSWLKANVQPFLPETHIRGIAIGNEVLGGSNQEWQEVLHGAIKNVHSALLRLGLEDLIEVSTAHSLAVFANTYPPSLGTFKESLLSYLKPLLDHFSKTNVPFYVNIYPFLAYNSDPNNIDINYALFESNPGICDNMTNLHYDNMFDAQIDATYAALQSAGYGRMEVRVSETGWASRGDIDEAGASFENARTYNYNLRKRLAKRKGTPLRPKNIVKAYIFALFNENLKPGKGSERNYGLFKADGKISYDIGLPRYESSSTSPLHFTLVDLSLGWQWHWTLILQTLTLLIYFSF